MEAQLKIEVRDSVFDPDLPPNQARVAHYRKGENGQAFYKVWLYLSGESLPYVQAATYVLHETFADPVNRIVRLPSNPDCRLTIWTWGLFEVKVTIEDKMGRIYETVHRLTYDRQLKQEGVQFKLDSDEPMPPSAPVLRSVRKR
jgi:hypothetical protein